MSQQERSASPTERPASRSERNLTIAAHLSGILGVPTAGLLGFVVPLLIYCAFANTYPFAGSQAKEALNFQITIVCLFAVCVAMAAMSCGVLLPLLILPAVLQLVFAIAAAIVTAKGLPFRYPFNLRFLRSDPRPSTPVD